LGQLLPRFDTLEQRLASLDEDVEGLRQSRQDGAEERRAMEARLEQRLDALDDSARSLGADLRELRQSQLAFSAQQEALR
jgi:predicted  nucleic acid-binding Zn-ribbon protein